MKQSESAVFMQRSEMKKILRKFKKSFLQMSVYFFMEFVRSLRSVAYFFALEKVRRDYFV
jgi:hypothetical protein